MKPIIILLLFVYTISAKKDNEKKEKKSIPPSFSFYDNTTDLFKCLDVRCPPISQPICVKLKYLSEEMKNETTYIIMLNKCEMDYMKCYKDIIAIEMPMKNCHHEVNGIELGKKRVKRKTHHRADKKEESEHSDVSTADDDEYGDQDVLGLIEKADKDHKKNRLRIGYRSDQHGEAASREGSAEAKKDGSVKSASAEPDKDKDVSEPFKNDEEEEVREPELRITRLDRRKRSVDNTRTPKGQANQKPMTPEEKRKRRMQLHKKKIQKQLSKLILAQRRRHKRQILEPPKDVSIKKSTPSLDANKTNKTTETKTRTDVPILRSDDQDFKKPMFGAPMFGGSEKLKNGGEKAMFKQPMFAKKEQLKETDSNVEGSKDNKHSDVPSSKKNKDTTTTDTPNDQGGGLEKVTDPKKKMFGQSMFGGDKKLKGGKSAMFGEPMLAGGIKLRNKDSHKRPMFAEPMFSEKSKLRDKNKGNKETVADSFKKPMFAKPMFNGKSKLKDGNRKGDKDNVEESFKRPMFGQPMFGQKNKLRNKQREAQEENGDSFRNPMFAKPMFSNIRKDKLRDKLRDKEDTIDSFKKPMFGKPMFGNSHKLRNKPVKREDNQHNEGFKKPLFGESMFGQHGQGKLKDGSYKKPMFAEPMFGKNENHEKLNNKEPTNDDSNAEDNREISKSPPAVNTESDKHSEQISKENNGGPQKVLNPKTKMFGEPMFGSDPSKLKGDSHDPMKKPMFAKPMFGNAANQGKLSNKDIANDDSSAEDTPTRPPKVSKPENQQSETISQENNGGPEKVVNHKIKMFAEPMFGSDPSKLKGNSDDPMKKPMFAEPMFVEKLKKEINHMEIQSDEVVEGDTTEKHETQNKRPNKPIQKPRKETQESDELPDPRENEKLKEADGFKKPMFAEPMFSISGKDHKLKDGDDSFRKPMFAEPMFGKAKLNNNDDARGDDRSENDRNRSADEDIGNAYVTDGVTEGVDQKEFTAQCPTSCPIRDVMVCVKCGHNIFRTFSSTCHVRMFKCQYPDENMELVARYPCVMSAPHHDRTKKLKGRLGEVWDDDAVLRYVWCKEKIERGVKEMKQYDPRCQGIRIEDEPEILVSAKLKGSGGSKDGKEDWSDK